MNNPLLLRTAVPSLLAAMDALTLEPDFQQFFRKAAGAVRQLLGADGTALILLDDRQEMLEYKLFEGERTHLLNAFKGLRFMANSGISGRALGAKTSIFIRDYPRAPDAMAQLVQAGLKTNLVIPLISSDQPLGVLASSWFANEDGSFNPPDISPELLALAERIASQIAVACHREKLERQLHELVSIDPLTRLLNRRGILAELDLQLERMQRQERSFALFYIDVDGLKAANDHWGHETGDLLLRDLADRLKDVVRKGDRIGRLGGDEFLIIADCDQNHIDLLAKRFLQALRAPFGRGRKRGRLSGSIGVVFAPCDGSDETSLLRKADAAMYAAKSQGGDTYVRATSPRTAQSEARFSAVDLEQALEREQLQLWYQPICLMKDLSLVGFEALLRWRKPDGEIISAGPLIQALEGARGDLEYRLGNWVLREAARQYQGWRQSSRQPDLHVNISARHFVHPSFLLELQNLCTLHPELGQRLIVEITETAMIEDLERAKRIMLRCHELGVRMAVDDFGTGYGSLTYLRTLPLDLIKIDRSFVAELPGNRVDWDISQGLVAIARALGLTVVAEGAETLEQVNCLQQMGCDQVQGYFIQKPMPFDEANLWLGQQSIKQDCNNPQQSKLASVKQLHSQQDPRYSLIQPRLASRQQS